MYGAPVWEVEDEGDVSVFAAPMSHGIPCVGYVVKEQDRPGRLRPDLIAPIIKRNYQALQDSVIKNPMKIMALIKNLPVGSKFTFPDGTIVKQSDVVQPPIKGRKIVILGDTLDPRAIEGETCLRISYLEMLTKIRTLPLRFVFFFSLKYRIS